MGHNAFWEMGSSELTMLPGIVDYQGWSETLRGLILRKLLILQNSKMEKTAKTPK